MRAKKGLREIREGLQYILTVLSEDGAPTDDFVLEPQGKVTKAGKKAKTRK
jgi:hypothetical protein